MIEIIVEMFTQFFENITAPGFDFYDIIAVVLKMLGLSIIL